MEDRSLKEEDMDKPICTCEDAPCCGHDRADRYTTWNALYKSINRDLRRIEVEEW